MKTFTTEELLKMIQEKDLKIVIVSEVLQYGFQSSYLTVNYNQEDLKKDIELYSFEVLSSDYRLMTEDEISFINKNGFEK